jgi:hypothetical protein
MNREDATAEKRMLVALTVSVVAIVTIICLMMFTGYVLWSVLDHVFGG